MTARVVCDTNVVVSALLFRGRQLDWLRHAFRTRSLVPLVSRETARELVTVLHYPKFELTDDDRVQLLGEYLPFTQTVDVPADAGSRPRPADPADQMFLELAVVGGAAALITGDSDLLELAGTAPVDILTPAEARDRLTGRSG